MSNKKYILSKEIVAKKLRRMALQVVENNYNEQQLILIGIKENGVVIANKIATYLKEIFKGDIKVIELSLDKIHPASIELNTPIDFNGKTILLIDDVANSGKTMLYALKPLLDQYPKKIQTLVLVARTHKAFPVAVDYVGLSLSTTLEEHIFVEVNGEDVIGAYLV
jgi:pyrimidine operon attenuation protein/uracil phosphoribosyltransferase